MKSLFKVVVFASYYESWEYTPADLYLMLNH